MIHEDDAAFVSDEFDDDSSAFVYQVWDKAKEKRVYLHQLRFRREDRSVVDRLSRILGGVVKEQDKEGQKFYWLNFQGRRVFQIIDDIADMVLRKTELVKLLQEFRKSLDESKAHRYSGRGKRKLTEKEHEHRKNLIKEIQKWNKIYYDNDREREKEGGGTAG